MIFQTACPACKTKFSLSEDKLPSGTLKLRCSKCREIFEVTVKEDTTVYRVVAANGNKDARNTMDEILKGANMEVTIVEDGVAALKVIEETKPHVAILDVALPNLYGFEVCQHIKDSDELSKTTKVILTAAVYDETRYKRKPVSLYGADDYIEMHHIPDMLIPKIKSLVNTGEAFTLDASMPTPIAPTPKEGGDFTEKLRGDGGVIDSADAEAQEKARKLARIIVSDILLYNSEEVKIGLKNNTIFKLLEDDIKDGLKYIRKKLPPEIKAEVYLKDAFDEFIEKKKKELGY